MRRGIKERIATFVERKSRYLIAVLLADGSAEAMRDALIFSFQGVPPEMRKSLTADRGSEFSLWREVEAALPGTLFYFADAGKPYQRATNENTNGLVRQFFPKYRDAVIPTPESVKRAQLLINFRPRKVLGWKSAISVFSLHLT